MHNDAANLSESIECEDLSAFFALSGVDDGSWRCGCATEASPAVGSPFTSADGFSETMLPAHNNAAMTLVINELRYEIDALREELVQARHQLHAKDTEIFSVSSLLDVARADSESKDRRIASLQREHKTFKKQVHKGMQQARAEHKALQQQLAQKSATFGKAMGLIGTMQAEIERRQSEIESLKKQMMLKDVEMQRMKKVRDSLLLHERDVTRLEEDLQKARKQAHDKDFELALVKQERDTVRGDFERLQRRLDSLLLSSSLSLGSEPGSGAQSPAVSSVAGSPATLVPSFMAPDSPRLSSSPVPNLNSEPMLTPRQRIRSQTTFGRLDLAGSRIEKLPLQLSDGASPPGGGRSFSPRERTQKTPRRTEPSAQAILSIDTTQNPVESLERVARALVDHIEAECAARGCTAQEAGNCDAGENEHLLALVSGPLLSILWNIFRHEIKGSGIQWIFTAASPFDLFSTIIVSSSSSSDPMQKKLADAMRDVNRFISKFTVQQGPLPCTPQEMKVRCLFATFINMGELDKLLHYVFCHPIAGTFYKASSIIKQLDAQPQIIKSCASICRLPIHISLGILIKEASRSRAGSGAGSPPAR